MSEIDDYYKELNDSKKPKGKFINYRTLFGKLDKVGKFGARFIGNVRVNSNKSVIADFMCYKCRDTYTEVIKKVAESDNISFSLCKQCKGINNDEKTNN